jgi:hypothetical protein
MIQLFQAQGLLKLFGNEIAGWIDPPEAEKLNLHNIEIPWRRFLKLKIHKTLKQIFCVCLVLAFVCIHTASTAQEPKRIALLPFKVNAEKDMSFLQNGIFDMLTSRLPQGC